MLVDAPCQTGRRRERTSLCSTDVRISKLHLHYQAAVFGLDSNTELQVLRSKL